MNNTRPIEALTPCCICGDTFDLETLHFLTCPDCYYGPELESLVEEALNDPTIDNHQIVINSPEHITSDVFTLEVELPGAPKHVWFLHGQETPEFPVEPVHHKNAFLLSLLHDCSYNHTSKKLQILTANPNAWYLIEV